MNHNSLLQQIVDSNDRQSTVPKDQLIIIGARGWGREVLRAFREYEKAGRLTIKGFLDDNMHALDGYEDNYAPILGPVEDYMIQPDDVFFCALGDPTYHQKYAKIIEDQGGRFISYISPLAIVYETAVVGNGSFIGAGACISDSVKIGKHCRVDAYTVLGHDVQMGDYASIDAFVFVGGFCQIASKAVIHSHSSIMAGKKVGAEAMVGLGSVIIRNVKDGAHVFGNPAKEILG